MKDCSASLLKLARQTLAASIMVIGSIWQPVQAALERGVTNGVPYLVGGWSIEGRKELTAQAAEYPVMLVFAEKNTGHYLADINVRVHDRLGQELLALDSAGPIVLIGLDPGTYRITVTHKGQSLARTINIGPQTRRQAVFYWSDAIQGG